MEHLKIKLEKGVGLELFSTKIYWGEKLESIESKLTPFFNRYHPKTPDISDVGYRFTKGNKFANYNSTEINGCVADGFDFQLGFNTENKFIEFCCIWNFDLDVELVNIVYCKGFTDQVNELKLNQLDLEELDCGSILLKKHNVILAKSSYQDPIWNKGDLVEYLYITQ